MISVDKLSKDFRLPKEHSDELKQTVVNFLRGIKGYSVLKVLKNISFKVERGDFFGIVGRNGSGKSTLLKIISGIYEPDKGSIQVNGSLVPFIELGVGFNPQLTGRENVYLNGALMGFSSKEIDAMYDEIVDFAELHDFMGQKLKNYSSGMQVRLAFSCAIRAKSDILVLDEVLAVGDEAFQRKCYNYFSQLKQHGKTVILVTHSMSAVQQFCNKALLLEDGRIKQIGSTTRISQLYRELFLQPKEKTRLTKNGFGNQYASAKVKCTKQSQQLHFQIEIRPKIDLSDAIIYLMLNDSSGIPVYRWVTDETIKTPIRLNKNQTWSVELTVENIFPNGVFTAQVGIKSFDRQKIYAVFDSIVQFEIVNRGPYAQDIYWKPRTKTQLLG